MRERLNSSALATCILMRSIRPISPTRFAVPGRSSKSCAGRFCLILAMLRHAATAPSRLPLPSIDPDIARDAWRLVEFHKSHHGRVRAALEGRGILGAPEGARLVLNWINNHKDEIIFSNRDIRRNYKIDLELLQEGCAWLVKKNVIRPLVEPARDADAPGRKPSPQWEIHPDLHASSHDED